MFRKTYHLIFHFSFPNATFHDTEVAPGSVSTFFDFDALKTAILFNKVLIVILTGIDITQR